MVALAGILILALVSAGEPPASDPGPLERAHSHNDYLHARPLLDAIDRGFLSVEADIFLVGGRLLVAHTVLDIRPGRTLEALYLDPLRERIRKNGGRVHPGSAAGLTLLIDLKTDAAPIYEALHKVLEGYREILTVWEDGKAEPGAVTVIISGNRPRSVLEAQKVRYAALDGRMGDLDGGAPAGLIPLISDSWRTRFRWDGKGAMPEAERADLQRIVEKAHAAGRRVRFWAAPDRPEAWSEFHAAGVDLINTDDLDGLARFLRDRKAARSF
jgi:hypothetical protein